MKAQTFDTPALPALTAHRLDLLLDTVKGVSTYLSTKPKGQPLARSRARFDPHHGRAWKYLNGGWCGVGRASLIEAA